MEYKPKKSAFDILIIILNMIVIIIMLANIYNAFTTQEHNSSLPSYNMGDIEILQFNGQFEIYEGIKTGVQIKQLIKTVSANNTSNPGQQVILVGDTSIFTSSENVDETISYKATSNIVSSKKYKVNLKYDNGIVSSIIIYQNEDVIENLSGNSSNSISEKTENNIENISNTESNNKTTNNNSKINWQCGFNKILSYSPVIIVYIVIFIYKKITKKEILTNYNGEESQRKLNKLNTIASIILLINVFIFFFITLLVGTVNTVGVLGTAHKPIIYIYPEEEIEVVVELGRKENLTCTYPLYEDQWNVIAQPDGTLVNKETGRTYYALYWEGKNIKKYTNKLEEGFVVKGEDTIKFLEEKLEILGLNEKEAEEFIVYWLPKLQNNKYNYIRFQTQEEINENMPLKITPEPDTLIRVMMEWKGLNKFEEVEEQQLEKVERKGYTVLEWGGTEIK